MGNLCCVCRQMEDDDEATNALLDSLDQYPVPPSSSSGRPRGPPPPYQARAPLYAMTDDQRTQWVQRLTMIQCLPLGRYSITDEKKEKDLKLELSDEVQGTEKKGDVDRECPICMMDFSPGEPIRLLPCMHFYHMRCIDDWLMRSYSCPTCMERVDVGMRDTMSSTSSGHPTLRRRRKRRRRGERGSSSSIQSITSHGSVQGAVDAYSKVRESVSRQFLVPDSCEEQLTASGGVTGSEECGSFSHDMEWSKEQEHGSHTSSHLGSSHTSSHLGSSHVSSHLGSSHASSHLGSAHASTQQGASHFPDYPVQQSDNAATAASSHQPDFMTGLDDLEEEVFSSHNYPGHRNSHRTVPRDPPYDVDQIIRISNFEVDPQEMGPFSPPMSPQSSGLAQATPVSPPMFEYHFEYPVAEDLTQSDIH